MIPYVVEGPGTEVLPEWMRTTLLGEDGTVYLPCGVFDEERIAFLCATYDNVPIVSYQRHLYAPADWLAREYPRGAHLAQVIKQRILTMRST